MKQYLIFKFDELEVEDEHVFELENYSKFTVNELIFYDSVISKIRVVKHKTDICKNLFIENVFIEGFIGHIKLFTIVTKDNYTFILDTSGIQKEYTIRPTEDYDYKIVEKQK